MKDKLAILSGKIVAKASKVMGKGGSTIPGLVARKIEPQLLRKLSAQIKDIILVTGTNGKTTTSNLLAQILKSAGKKVLHNIEGANLITGITATFVKGANLLGSMDYDCAVIEVDEATLPLVLKQLTPKAIIVTNFFRDQLDRFGEIDMLLKKIEDGIRPVETSLILNGDDPFVYRFAKLKKPTVFYGIKRDAHHFEQYQVSESKYCPDCGQELEYEYVHYGQLGYFSCPCGFARPQPEYEIDKIETKPAISFQVNGVEYGLAIPGSYNIYNALPAIACASEYGIEAEDIRKGLRAFTSTNGRMQVYTFGQTTCLLNLVKNPAGVNISLSEALSEQEDKQIALFLNDMDVDGRDISWIWDADFERLNREDVKRIICSGSRAYDLGLRMKYAGMEENKIIIIESKEEAIEYTLQHPVKTYLLPNYTALSPVWNYLNSKKTDKKAS